MNQEARRLRANQTHAVTPSGLDGPGQYTSACDLALIARACFAREDFRRYIATRVAYVPAQPGKPGFQIVNDNTLLDGVSGMLGGKTGFRQLARGIGFIVQPARRDVVQVGDAGCLTARCALMFETASRLGSPSSHLVAEFVTSAATDIASSALEANGDDCATDVARDAFVGCALCGVGQHRRRSC